MTLNPKITINRRHQRDTIICVKIMEMVDKHFQPYNHSPKAFYDDLFNFIHNSGMEIITDDMRKEAGLEPRNENGCTPLELMLIEYYFMSRMLKPIIVQMPQPSTVELINQNTVMLPYEEPTQGYPKEMIYAGEQYLKSVSMDKQVHLPALFNWHKFISVLLSAIKE